MTQTESKQNGGLAKVREVESQTVLARLPELPAAIVEKLIIKGDLAALDADERVIYYITLCKRFDLDPASRPFEYIPLNGKLVLYARKDCAEQLRVLHGVSVTHLERQLTEGLLMVTVNVQNAKGRTDIATGAVAIGNLRGNDAANAYMKAETKAKRRATLSLCGLGMLDETELETVPQALEAPAIVAPVAAVAPRAERPVEPAKPAEPPPDPAERIRELMRRWQAIKGGDGQAFKAWCNNLPNVTVNVVADWTENTFSTVADAVAVIEAEAVEAANQEAANA